MIVRETAEHFICYKQPDHAVISGEVAKAWNRNLLPSSELFAETCYAVEHHDDGWKIPDEQPIWNDALKQPASFVHYPLALKLHFYTEGLNSLQNDYAKLLCSIHYASFFTHATGAAEQDFYLNEKLRQNSLLKSGYDEMLTDYHFRMLQFCDDISLFMCLHAPGTQPENFGDWFKNGFRQSEILLHRKEKIEIRWQNESSLQLLNSPLQQIVSVMLPHKRLNKKECSEQGLEKTWKKTPFSRSTFTIL